MKISALNRMDGCVGAHGVTRPANRVCAAFTLVEIAICLAVIGFALVAIVGVLPLGLNAQKENREDTIIDHDANYFVNLIRNGERGADDLTNYVFAITNYWTQYEISTGVTNQTFNDYDGYRFESSRVSPTHGSIDFRITNGYRIVGLLSRPRYELFDGGSGLILQSNYTVAYVRALTGAATEKVPQTNPAVRDLAFSYRFIPEITAPQTPLTNTFYGHVLSGNLREVRLLFRWPLLPNGQTGGGRELYRTQMGGRMLVFNDVGHPLYFFDPDTYARTP